MRPRPWTLVPAAVLCALSLAAPASAAPDRYRADQWGLDVVFAPEAWQQSSGDRVIVAVVDSGVDIGHPDLAGNVWTNPDEIAGNGVDDDANGIVDDVHGANLLDHSANVSDEQDHGTLVAGIIAARADNGLGGAGLAPRAQIMPVKVCSLETGCKYQAQAEGIRYAVSEGARIINVSMTSETASTELAEAVAFAEANGATVVAASGNDRRNIDHAPTYPAGLPDAAVLSVTAITERGGMLSRANYGSGSVDLAAPGDMIVSTAPGGSYELSTGTSVAAPFVSGSLALLAAARPDLSQPELRAALISSARRTRAVAGKVGAGQLDVGAAMHALVEGDWGAPIAHIAVTPPHKGARRARVRLRAPRAVRAGRRVNLRWKAVGAGAVKKWRVKLSGRTRMVGKRKHRAPLRAVRAGHRRWTVTGYDASGHKVVRASRTLRVVRR